MNRMIFRTCCHAAMLSAALLSLPRCARDARASAVPAAVPPGDGSVFVSPASPLRQKLLVAAVESRLVRSRLVVPAAVEADPGRLARVTPPLTGRIRQLFVRQGEIVRKEQPLFALDAPDVVAARADVLRSRTMLVQAEQALRRERDLVEHGVGAQRELEDAEAAYAVARDESRRASARLQFLGIESGDLDSPLVVRSPLAGQVLSLSTAPGEFRNDATAPLLVVADLSKLWLTASLPERDAEKVRVGDEVRARVTALPDREFLGRVLFIENVLDPETRTVKVRIQLENPEHRLKPGMFASAAFLAPPLPALVVPTAALLLGDANDVSSVWVEREPWTFARRAVRLASQETDFAVVAEGLAAGERIVVENGALLR